ncbi:MAG: AAC(3) family N-acetyltransferase [Clostridia bacterium]|nr:AAC(3) family N-acetyltransferase [Clostridia bacterium]
MERIPWRTMESSIRTALQHLWMPQGVFDMGGEARMIDPQRKDVNGMNREELVIELRRIGLQPGMEIEVHSSLRSLGDVEGGAETVVDALMECVGQGGSIFMPALRLSLPEELSADDRRMGITQKLRILPEDAARTGMGAVADAFRLRPDVMTGKGVIRTSGWGLHAEEAARGGLDYVIRHGGKALLLGVDIYKLTAMHYMEDILPTEISAIFAPAKEVEAVYPPDKWFIETGEPPVRAWYTIQRMAYERGVIREGTIGSCKAMFFDIMDVVGIYREELERDPFGLYGLR